MKKEENSDKNLHKNHRERLRKKFMESHGDALEEHELLELLLYYVYTQKNTNDIARRLLKRFGDIYNVFEASAEELMTVSGIGPQAAALLMMQATYTRRYAIERYCEERNQNPNNIFLTSENAGDYIVNFFYGYKDENLMMFALDKNLRVKSSVRLAKGTIDKVQFFAREIMQNALSSKATYVIIAHNHPNGDIKASENDLFFSMELEKALDYVGIKLIDHIIVSGREYLSMSKEYNIFKPFSDEDRKED